MGLLDGTTQQQYYQGNNLGEYQFVSLEDIINQFMVVYVGDQKIISKASRIDVAFHAQRALAELSFDTFKSIKSQEIVLPASLQMILPHDYVNYTKLTWADSAGIKHPLYPTNRTSNPFKILQDSNNFYDFNIDGDVLIPNSDFSSVLNSVHDWNQSPNQGVGAGDTQGVVGGQLEFFHNVQLMSTLYSSRHYAVWQEVDVSGIETITITADGLSSATGTNKSEGIIRIGISTLVDFNQTSATSGYDPNRTNPNLPNKPSRNGDVSVFNLTTLDGDPSYIEWISGNATLTSGTVTEIDVSNETTVYLLITSEGGQSGSGAATGTNAIDNISITFDTVTNILQSGGESTTWSNYKSNTPSENNNDDYEDNTYWPANGERYGLDPQHAQVNGSFYIDNVRGLIHFSSNISGKTVILDYISDSLGTDGEMQVHKFAEDAMYKWITHAVLSTSSYGQALVPRLTKDKFAAVRKAKLRLSNLKIEELIQVLRGKSKHIKH